MKKSLWLIFSLLTSMCFAQSPVPSGCGASNWPAGMIEGTSRTYSVPVLSGATYHWVVSGASLQIVSGQGTPTATIRGVQCGAGTVYVTRYKDGASACADKLDVNVHGLGCGGPINPNPTTCEASVHSAHCSPYFLDGHNSLIDLNVSLTNPFPNQATARAQWNPANINGIQRAGGILQLAPGASALLASQFSFQQINNNHPAGFYVPSIVVYTDNVTGETCTVYLNPLLNGCNGNPQRIASTPLDDLDVKPVGMILFNMNGTKVMERELNGELPPLDSPTQGLHILHLKMEDGSVLRKKVIIQ